MVMSDSLQAGGDQWRDGQPERKSQIFEVLVFLFLIMHFLQDFAGVVLPALLGVK
jgi:hypothetical protein